MTSQSFLFRLTKPVYRFIILWGVATAAGAEAFAKAPGSVITIDWILSPEIL